MKSSCRSQEIHRKQLLKRWSCKKLGHIRNNRSSWKPPAFSACDTRRLCAWLRRKKDTEANHYIINLNHCSEEPNQQLQLAKRRPIYEECDVDIELGRHHIIINIIHPSSTNTPVSSHPVQVLKQGDWTPGALVERRLKY